VQFTGLITITQNKNIVRLFEGSLKITHTKTTKNRADHLAITQNKNIELFT